MLYQELGTHTFREALAPHLADDDWQQQALFTQTQIPINAIANIGHGHVSFLQAKKYLPTEIWQSYFKFAIVRNPFDRYVSVCAFLNKHNPSFSNAAIEFMMNAIQASRFQQRILVQPQQKMLTDESGNIAMDYVWSL